MTPTAIALLWIKAFNEHDVSALVALYARGAVHVSPKLRVARPETKGRIVGKPALVAWWTDAFMRHPTLEYRLKAVTATKTRVFIEYDRHVTNDPDLPVAEVFEIANGRITASAVYHG